MSRSPVHYAENVLGVHTPWKEAQSRLAAHDEASQKITSVKAKIRHCKNQIESRKMELVTEAPAKYPDMSATARKEQVKVDTATDNRITAFQLEVDSLERELDEAEASRRHHELGLHVLTARMNELGGLLQFYAVAKAAEANT